MVAAGFKVFLSHLSGTTPVAITTGFDQVVEYARRNETALIIVGQGLDWATPLSELRRLHRGNPEWRMVLLADVGDRETIVAGLAAGAVGILSTSVEEEELHTAMARILAGGKYIEKAMTALGHEFPSAPAHRLAYPMRSPLTPRQLEVLGVLARGKSNKQIAELLSISLSTVSMHLNAIFHALGVHDRTSAAMAYRDLIWPDPDCAIECAAALPPSHHVDLARS